VVEDKFLLRLTIGNGHISYPTMDIFIYVASQHIFKMSGYPLILDFVQRNMKSIEFSHELIYAISSSSTSLGFTIGLSASWSIVVVS